MKGSTESLREQSKGRDLADRSTPFIRREWYVAALAEEVSSKPIHRVMLGEDIVLYRKQDGQPVALQNRCPHRSYPLSSGRVEEDKIICGYHGMQFRPDGQCALIPSLQTAPKALRVEAYPLKELGPFIWIWMGGNDRVDEGRFVDQPCFGAGWRWVHGYSYMKASYLGLHENLMDTSHFPFLHGAVLGDEKQAEVMPDIRADEGSVTLSILHRGTPMFSPKLQALVGGAETVDRLGVGRVQGPAGNFGYLAFTNPTNPELGYTDHLLHLVTPETATTTHYYWALARNVLVDDEEMQHNAQQLATTAFLQDVAALEEIEALIARDHRPDFREKLIATDVGGVQVLRLFVRQAAGEQQTA